MNGDVLRGLIAGLDPAALTPVSELDRWVVGGRTPSAVVTPGSVEELASTLRAARGVHVVPVGGRTHLGVVCPLEPFIVISTGRLAGVQTYEPADLTLTAGAGTKLSALSDALGAHGQWLPCDSPRAPERTLGGLAATGSAAPLWAGYGALRDQVLGLTVVTGDGTILKLGGRVMKNVAGFDLVRLMVGSRGTLGVIVSVSVRVFPRPAVDRFLVLRATSVEDLLEAAGAVVTAPVMPASAVVAEPERGGGAALVVRLHGAAGAVEADRTRLERHADVRFEAVEGESAVHLAHGLRDQGFGQPLVLGLAAPPSRLADTLAVARTMPHATLMADVMSGRMRVGMPAVPPRAVEWVASCRRAMKELQGTLVVESAPPDVAAVATASPKWTDDLEAGLREVFDPRGVLWHRGALP